jgi:hypothetical protein
MVKCSDDGCPVMDWLFVHYAKPDFASNRGGWHFLSGFFLLRNGVDRLMESIKAHAGPVSCVFLGGVGLTKDAYDDLGCLLFL